MSPSEQPAGHEPEQAGAEDYPRFLWRGMGNEEHQIVKLALEKRRELPKEERGAIQPPPPAKGTFGGAVHWGLAALWQDLPMLVVIGGIGVTWQTLDSLYIIVRWLIT